MLKIRLTRRGKKRQPTYRVVVADVESKRDGRYVELLGWYNPLTDPITYRIKEDRALYWLGVGAQPTDAVRRLLQDQGTLDRLPRLHKGESIEALVAEFEGRSLEDEAEEEAAEETTEEETTEEEGVLEAAAETVAEVAEDAVEAVEETVEAVAEAVEEAVSDDDADEDEDKEEKAEA